jgi:hypothetical protein
MNAAGIAKLFELRGGDIDAVAMNFCYHSPRLMPTRRQSGARM